MLKLYENTALEEKYYKCNVNGLDVYVIPKQMSTVYASIAVNFGSSDTQFAVDGKNVSLPAGTAHYLEHKMFDNPDGTDAFEQFSLLGANVNAYTASAKTCYLFSCTENFEECLRLLFGVVTKPVFSDASVEKERPIITQEIRMYMDDPYWKMHFALLDALYYNDPIRTDPAGTEETIAEITPELLYDCHRSFYTAENMALCVCGDVDPQRVADIAAECIKPSVTEKPLRLRPTEPVEIRTSRAENVLDVATPLFAVGIKCIPPQSGDELMRAEAENEIIVQAIFGKSGSFYNKCYESGLLGDRYSCGYSNEAGTALVMLYGSGNDPDRVYELIKEELDSRRDSFCTVEEFERAKKVCYSSALEAYNGTEDTANAFLGFVFEGGDLLRYTDFLRGADYDSVKARFAAQYRSDRSAISVIYSKEA
ncbi:MAG: insulinase family protein [Ruminococcaceae bacterium]|nr:insulinase family protein [Oscillospiraceae bacterium]